VVDRAHDERGDTLVEMLITIVLVGIVAAAILGALMIAMHSSTTHRNLSTDDTLARSALEAIKNQVETPQGSSNKFPPSDCTSPNAVLQAWTQNPASSTYINLPSQANYTVAITGIGCWDPVVTKAFSTTCNPCTPSGLVQVTVTVTDPTNYKLSQSTVVRNPGFNGSYNGKY
jgi:prepilin-type N-terminal cleavage/methylation domain-containing protein